MKAVLQRVTHAGVQVGKETVGEIGAGLLILLGVARGDGENEASLLARKTAGLRIFADEAGKLNRSLLDVGGGALVVSNFTLCADCRRGRRPDFVNSADSAEAFRLYSLFIEMLSKQGVSIVRSGRFGADMKVSLDGDGPVTIVLDTDELR